MESNTFQYLNSILREIATCAAMGAAYESWSDDFARKEVREAWLDKEAGLRSRRGRSITADEFWSMSADEMTALGFGTWDDSGLRLVPLWAWNYIADGQMLTCIDGTKVKTKGTDHIDLDVRFGCIAYGFAPALKSAEVE